MNRDCVVGFVLLSDESHAAPQGQFVARNTCTAPLHADCANERHDPWRLVARWLRPDPRLKVQGSAKVAQGNLHLKAR